METSQAASFTFGGWRQAVKQRVSGRRSVLMLCGESTMRARHGGKAHAHATCRAQSSTQKMPRGCTAPATDIEVWPTGWPSNKSLRFSMRVSPKLYRLPAFAVSGFLKDTPQALRRQPYEEHRKSTKNDLLPCGPPCPSLVRQRPPNNPAARAAHVYLRRPELFRRIPPRTPKRPCSSSRILSSASSPGARNLPPRRRDTQGARVRRRPRRTRVRRAPSRRVAPRAECAHRRARRDAEGLHWEEAEEDGDDDPEHGQHPHRRVDSAAHRGGARFQRARTRGALAARRAGALIAAASCVRRAGTTRSHRKGRSPVRALAGCVKDLGDHH